MPARALVSLLLVAAACGTTVEPPAWRLPPRAQSYASVFSPVGEPAARYNDRAPRPPASRLLTRLVDTVAHVAERSGKAAPVPDGRLFAVAGELAGILREGPPPYDAVSFALSFHGIIEPSPHLLVIRSESNDEDGVAAELEARLPEVMASASFARLGVGIAPNGTGSNTVVVALQESAIETEPIPRELPVGGTVRLKGRILHPYTEPKIFVTGPSGVVAGEPVARDEAGGFSAEIRCEDAGRLKVEIVGEDRTQNPTVLANFAVFCGETAPRSLSIKEQGSPASDAGAVERELFERVNEDRRQSNLAPLIWDERAAAIARKHSEEMRDKEFVAHVSPTTGTASDRARAGGLATPLLLENLARSYSAVEAESGLMDSPGHRANLLSPLATHIGIGVALGHNVGSQRELYVTQLFFRVTPIVEQGAARDEVLQALVKARRDARLSPLVEDQALRAVADKYAGALAKGKSREEAAAEAEVALDRLSDRFRRVMTIVEISGDPDDSIRADVLDAGARAFGLGLAQGRHPDLGDGAYYVVILLARNR